MNKITFAVITILALCICGSAWACDTTCPTGFHWVWQDQGNDKGSCQKDPTDPTSTITNTNTNTNANLNNNSSGSKSSSSSNATGGSVTDNSKTTNTNTAIGGSVKDSGNSSSTVKDSGNSTIKDSGNSSIKDSGNSSVKNSGNSSNKNTNKQGQAQGQQQSQTQTNEGNNSTNTNEGNNSSYSSSYREAAQSAVAVAPYPTAQCFKGGAIGGQAMTFGFSASAGRIDENCAILEVARNFDSAGERLAACKVKISNKYAKAAGVTLDDCMTVPVPTPVAIVPAPAPVVIPAPQVVVTIPKAEPAPVVTQVPIAAPKPQLVGVCTFAPDLQCDKPGASKPDPLRVTSVCDEMLTAAVKLLTDNPGIKIRLIGNANRSEREFNTMSALGRAKNVERELVKFGASPDRIIVTTGGGNSRTVELWLE